MGRAVWCIIVTEISWPFHGIVRNIERSKIHLAKTKSRCIIGCLLVPTVCIAEREIKIDWSSTRSTCWNSCCPGHARHKYCVSVYPNPAENNITFEFDIQKAGKAALGIYDVLGRNIYNIEWNASKGRKKKNIDISKCASGLYFIKLVVDGHSSSIKFSKQ